MKLITFTVEINRTTFRGESLRTEASPNDGNGSIDSRFKGIYFKWVELQQPKKPKPAKKGTSRIIAVLEKRSQGFKKKPKTTDSNEPPHKLIRAGRGPMQFLKLNRNRKGRRGKRSHTIKTIRGKIIQVAEEKCTPVEILAWSPKVFSLDALISEGWKPENVYKAFFWDLDWDGVRHVCGKRGRRFYDLCNRIASPGQVESDNLKLFSQELEKVAFHVCSDVLGIVKSQGLESAKGVFNEATQCWKLFTFHPFEPGQLASQDREHLQELLDTLFEREHLVCEEFSLIMIYFDRLRIPSWPKIGEEDSCPGRERPPQRLLFLTVILTAMILILVKEPMSNTFNFTEDEWFDRAGCYVHQSVLFYFCPQLYKRFRPLSRSLCDNRFSLYLRSEDISSLVRAINASHNGSIQDFFKLFIRMDAKLSPLREIATDFQFNNFIYTIVEAVYGDNELS